jgi:hypothetical protein
MSMTFRNAPDLGRSARPSNSMLIALTSVRTE